MSKRRWFQIHLSTAMVLMLVAAVLIGLNTRARSEPLRLKFDDSGTGTLHSVFFELPHYSAQQFGWPFTFAQKYGRNWGVNIADKSLPNLTDKALIRTEYLEFQNLSANIIVGLLILMHVAYASEFTIRLRENHKRCRKMNV
jgi:hypothetical protein